MGQLELSSLELFVWAFAILTSFFISLFMFDDLFVDIYALIHGLKPKKISPELRKKMEKANEKRIAILVANWHEHEVLERMVSGNVENIEYKNYCFFIGVYPNDELTWAAASRLQQRYKNVHVIVNTLNGPTTKGQMLNQMVHTIRTFPGPQFDIFMLHDSEDLIHPYSLKLVNYFSRDYSFMQIPVYSLPTPLTDWTAGVYADEFSESHLKDLLVRNHMGAGTPSAGVGTAMTRRLVDKLLVSQAGELLRHDCLAEDYVLGLTSHSLKFKNAFLNYYFQHENYKDLIATREYFPDEFHASIRQKTRWITGIAFQGRDLLNWRGHLAQCYFFWRDRRSLPNAILIFCSALVIPFVLASFTSPHFDILLHSTAFKSLAMMNLMAMFWRFFQRVRFVYFIYGSKLAWGVPVRWVVGNIINTWATLKAFQRYSEFLKTGQQLKWVKTTHKLPANFGKTVEIREKHNEKEFEVVQ